MYSHLVLEEHESISTTSCYKWEALTEEVEITFYITVSYYENEGELTEQWFNGEQMRECYVVCPGEWISVPSCINMENHSSSQTHVSGGHD